MSINQTVLGPEQFPVHQTFVALCITWICCALQTSHKYLQQIYVKKSVQIFIETYCKGDIVVRDIKQQRLLFHHYKIKFPTSPLHIGLVITILTMYNGEVGNFVMVKKLSLLFYISNDNVNFTVFL